MKQLIFIDNDGEEQAKSSLHHAQRNLHYYANISDEIINKMQPVYDFYHMEKEEKYKLLFDNKDIAICTWSMYTSTHLNSYGQLISLLVAVGRNQISDRVYIDTSGEIE